ncbi:unnamed protein product [Rotaria socialis]|uniref:Ubiquitin carboxyl-terminal hydrolase 36 n=1 Tax=Rotaria socialis TaxID=392032 RepID=A0A821ANL3_9BILA|nr:unnamed protein product [Rotaria socialis]
MTRPHIRTINGAQHNGHLGDRYSRVQNRAAAMLDAWHEFGESLTIDVVAHMHRLSITQIEKDMFGEPSDIKKRYGTKSTVKLERVLQKCINELNDGVNRALVAVAHHVPFILIRALEENPNIKEVATTFLIDIKNKLNAIDEENKVKRIDDALQKYTKLKSLNRSPLRSIENQPVINGSSLQTEESLQVAESFDDLLCPQVKTTRCSRKELHIAEIEEHEQLLSTCSSKLCHQSKLFLESDLQLKWTLFKNVGVGLENTNDKGECKNICYINAIIQCLAYIAPLVQWLSIHFGTSHCELSIEDQFCSVCMLHSVICSIHRNIETNSTVLCDRSCGSAESFAQKIEQLSPSFTIGRQEDPSEFLQFLLDHLVTCLTPNKSMINVNLSKTPIEYILGLEIQSISTCKVCLRKSIVKNWESVLSLSIISHATIVESLEAFFFKEELHGENLYEYIQELNKENNTIDNFVYKLNSVVVHLGENATSGHVFTYVRSPDETWYTANDESMKSTRLDTVLGDKDAYILCYTKVPKSSAILSDTNMIISPARSSLFLTSSTPINSSKIFDKNTNNYTTRNFYNNIAVSSKNFFEENRATNNLLSTEYSSIMNNTILLEPSSTQECSSPTYIQSFNENSMEFSMIETESRIEIIPNSNNTQNNLNKRLSNNIHKNQLSSSILEREQNSSTTSLHKQVSSSESRYQQLPLQIFGNDRFVPSSSQRAHMPSSMFENEPILSPISDNEHISSATSRNTRSSIQLNETVHDSVAGNDFIAELPSHHQFNLRAVDLAKLLVIRTAKNNKKKDRLFRQMGLSNVTDITTPSRKIFLSKQTKLLKSTFNTTVNSQDSSIHIPSEQIKQSNVDVEYFYILLPYIKQLNKYCGLCVRNTTFGATNNLHHQLLRCNLRCIAHPTCSFSCSVIVQNNGTGNIIVTNGTVRHVRGVKICRPIRAPVRSLIKKRFAQGASVHRMYQEKLQKRTPEERRGQNYDGIGKNRDVLRKIKSEVNPSGKIKGAIQSISKYPCQIIVYSESSIRLFDALLKHNNVILSWDATGSIIKETNSHRLLYYELSITLPGIVKEDSIVPITFMISDAHALVDIIHWLQLFKHSYSQVYPGKKFPRPRIVLSDRAQVFLIASLRVWNNESMNDFLNRAYRIVTDKCTDSDIEKTNIHACLAHVLLDSRKIINKFVPETFRVLAMWSIALLINTSTWNEFVHNWQLICFVFIQLHLGEENVNKDHQNALIYKISKIENDPNISSAIKLSETVEDENEDNLLSSNVYNYYDDDEEIHSESVKHRSKSTQKKIIVDEEKEANATDSPFKSIINGTFHDVLATYSIWITEIRDKKSRGILKWFKYLTASFMPTLPIWSNLLLGDLNRHRRRIVRSYESIILLNKEQRTTAISERRMGIVKRNQLGGVVHLRLDVLLSILVPDMLSMVDEYWNTLLSYCSTSISNSSDNSIINIDEQRLKPIEERWRQKVSRRGLGHYAKCPDQQVFTDVLSCLLTSQIYFNDNIKLPTINPNWLNVGIGILLSVGNNNNSSHHRFNLISANDSPLLSTIATFLDEWCNSSARDIRSTTINFPLLNFDLNQTLEQSTYILEKILIPLLPCRLIINKVYTCKSCESTIKVRCIITSIPVHVSKNGLYLERDLFDFFDQTTSDLHCSTCKKSTIRHIEVIEWPRVLLININDSIKNTRHRKPPGIISLAQFSSWIAVGCPSASIYDLACFTSVMSSGGNETMVRITKVKKSWLTSMHKRVIGDGDQLRRLYANSRILVFERIHHQNKLNFIYAIMQCTLNRSSIVPANIPVCATIQEACYIISTHPDLTELNNALISNIKTTFYCYSCHKVPDSLQKQAAQIYIYKLPHTNKIVAHPVLLNVDVDDSRQEHCTYCNCSSKNIEMPVCKQVFIQCPRYLIRFVESNFQINNLFDSRIKLTDDQNAVHCYKPAAILLISRYSDTATVIKQEAGVYVEYNGNTYSQTTPLSNSKMADLFDTCGAILLFYHQYFLSFSFETVTDQSRMRIISQANVNGGQRIIIQDGERLFAITATQTNTKNS